MAFIIGLVSLAVGLITVYDFVQRKARYAKWKLSLINARSRPDIAVPVELVDAMAGLLVHARLARGDGISDRDAEDLSALISSRFALSTFEADAKLRSAFDTLQAHDLSHFTRGIKKNMDQDGRQEVIRTVYRSIHQGRTPATEEKRAILRIGAQLGVSNNDCVRIEIEVEAENRNQPSLVKEATE